MTYFDKTYHPPGTPPGTLQEAGAGAEALRITLINYNHTEYHEQLLEHARQCRELIREEHINWIHVQGACDTVTLKTLGEQFDLHTLAMEDVLNAGQRAKAEEHQHQLFVILALPTIVDEDIEIHQVSLFLGNNYIISFHDGPQDPFAPLRHRLQKRIGRIGDRGSDYLLYAIMDLAIDQGYPVVEFLGEKIETMEEQLLDSGARKTSLADIHYTRQQLMQLRRKLWPHRELLNDLMHEPGAFITETTLFYLRDCRDHTLQILELIDSYRELSANLLDVYLSLSNHRLAEIMRVLTMIATVFIPLTFVVGLYGMNFTHPNSPWAMPELHWYYGYPMVWGIMLTLVIGMFIYFKRKNWF